MHKQFKMCEENSTQCEEISLLRLNDVKKAYQETFEKETKEFLVLIDKKIRECCEKEKFLLCIPRLKYSEWNLDAHAKWFEPLKKLFCDLGYIYVITNGTDFMYFQIIWENCSIKCLKTMDILMNGNEANKLTIATIERNLEKEIAKSDKIIKKKCRKGNFKCLIKIKSEKNVEAIIHILKNLRYDVWETEISNTIVCQWYDYSEKIKNVDCAGVGKIIPAMGANELSYDSMSIKKKNKYIEHLNEKIDKASKKMQMSEKISCNCRAYVIAKKYDGELDVKIEKYFITFSGWA